MVSSHELRPSRLNLHWDRLEVNRSHKETVAQLKIAQDQMKILQNAERAWILTELNWTPYESKVRDEPKIKTTEVFVTISCKNEGRSPAWVDKIKGHAEIVQGEIHDPAPVGHMQHFSPIGPIALGKSESRNLNLVCPGHAKDTDLISVFVLVEYRDVFEQRRFTSCGYTVNIRSRDDLTRQDMPQRNRNT